jgi:hypothetical protein
MKTKGQPQVAKLERLALVSFCGGLAEWSNAADCKSVNGGPTAVLGFESLTRRQILTSPTRSANCEQGLSLGLAPKAGLFRSTAIVRPFPKKRKVHSDVPQLQNRASEGREGSEQSTAVQVPAVKTLRFAAHRASVRCGAKTQRHRRKTLQGSTTSSTPDAAPQAGLPSLHATPGCSTRTL